MIRGNLEGNMQLLLCGKHSKMMMMLRRRRMFDNLYFVAVSTFLYTRSCDVLHQTSSIASLDFLRYHSGFSWHRMQLRMCSHFVTNRRSRLTFQMSIFENIARIANAVQVTICLLVSTSVYQCLLVSTSVYQCLLVSTSVH